MKKPEQCVSLFKIKNKDISNNLDCLKAYAPVTVSLFLC